MASQKGHCKVVRLLVEAKADVNIKDNVRESCFSDCVCALAESIRVHCIHDVTTYSIVNSITIFYWLLSN